MVIINAEDVLVRFCPIHKEFGDHWYEDEIKILSYCPGFTKTLDEILKLILEMIE